MNLTAWCAGSIFAVLALHACASERAETGRLCSAQVELAEELMSEQNWEAALCESRRALILGPTNQAARLIGLLSQVRLGRKPSGVLQELEAIAANADSPRLGAMAAYEAARLLVESGDWTRAYEWLKLVFLRADDRDLFMKSGCTLSLLLKEHPELEPGNADIRTRILTSEHL